MAIDFSFLKNERLKQLVGLEETEGSIRTTCDDRDLIWLLLLFRLLRVRRLWEFLVRLSQAVPLTLQGQGKLRPFFPEHLFIQTVENEIFWQAGGFCHFSAKMADVWAWPPFRGVPQGKFWTILEFVVFGVSGRRVDSARFRGRFFVVEIRARWLVTFGCLSCAVL